MFIPFGLSISVGILNALAKAASSAILSNSS